MIRRKYLALAFGALSFAVAPLAFAQGPVDQRTYFTFSAPFELPGGKTLPAGKYTFRVLDSPSNRHIVQVLSEDGRNVHATVLAIPAQRQDPPAEPEIRFMETAANTPPAIRTWWYPGRTIGHEFIYPRSQARRLAKAQSEPVLTVAADATSNDQMEKADLERVSPSGEETRVSEETRAAATTPAPSTVNTAPAPRPVTTTADRTERTTLPRTASSGPMIALAAVLALSLAGALRLRRS
jgi:hypothetical protein